ncbi:hypothetical protein ACE38W_03115 [Chitinophaga sp. Hz27]
MYIRIRGSPPAVAPNPIPGSVAVSSINNYCALAILILILILIIII